MKKFLFLTLILLMPFCCQLLQAQNSTPDKIPDLEKLLSEATEAQKKAFLCNELSFAYNKTDKAKALEFAVKALGFAKDAANTEEEIKSYVLQATIYNGQRKYDEAEKYANLGLDLSKSSGDKKGEGNSLNVLGNIYKSKQKVESALKYYTQSLNIRQEIFDNEGIGASYHNLGILSGELGDLMQARNYLLQAVSVKEKLNKPASLAITLGVLGGNYNQVGDDFSKAESYLLRAMQINEETANKSGLMTSCQGLGNMYFAQGKYRQAKEMYEKGMVISEQMKDSNMSSVLSLGLGKCHYNMGDYETALKYTLNAEVIITTLNNNQQLLGYLYEDKGNILTAQTKWDEALIEYNKGIELAKKNKINTNLGTLLTSRATVFLRKDNPTEALKNFEEADGILIGLGKNISYSNNLIGMGKVLFTLSRFDEALIVFKKAEQSAIANKAKDVEAIAVRKIASVLQKQSMKQLQEAKKLAEKGLKMSEASENLLNIQGARIELEEIDRLLQQREAAYIESEKIGKIRDSIWNQDKASKMTAMDLNFKFEQEKLVASLEQQKKDIAQQAELSKRNSWLQILGISFFSLLLVSVIGYFFLRNRQKLQRVQLEQQSASNRLEALRSQINPHFLFNCMNSIANFIETREPAKARGYLAEFAKLMRGTLEQSGMQTIPLQQEMETLRQYLNLESIRLSQNIDFEVSASNELDDFDTLIPPMMVQPFVENAIWHGLSPKKEKGRIRVFFESIQGKLVCTVEDNGVGRSPAPKNNPDHISAGMRIMKERFELLSLQSRKKIGFDIQDMKTESGEALGTKVVLQFP